MTRIENQAADKILALLKTGKSKDKDYMTKCQIDIENPEVPHVLNAVFNTLFEMSCWNSFDKQEGCYVGQVVISGVTKKGKKFLEKYGA